MAERRQIPGSQSFALPMHIIVIPFRPGVPQVALQFSPSNKLHNKKDRFLVSTTPQQFHHVRMGFEHLHHFQLGNQVALLFLVGVLF